MISLRIHICTIGEKQFDDFLVFFSPTTTFSRNKQRSPSINSLRIHIRTFGDK